MNLVKSKRRVADHGEVFTPAWMVEAMLDLLDTLTQSSALSAEGTLFAHLGKHEVFTPEKSYPPVTIGELAAGASA